MKKLKFVLPGLLVIALQGCSAPGESNLDTSCADVTNVGQTHYCADPAVASKKDTGIRLNLIKTAHAAVPTIINKPEPISRLSLMRSVAALNNSTGGAGITVYIKGWFDAGCAGQPIWEITPYQAVSVGAGSVYDFIEEGMCTDMPTGPRKYTVEVYQDQNQTILLDVVEVRFVLQD